MELTPAARAARFVRMLALAVWLGVVVAAAIAVPAVHAAMGPDRMQSSARAGGILHLATAVGISAGLVALLCEAMLFFRRPPVPAGAWRRAVPALLLMCALVVAALAALWMEPRLLEARDSIWDFSPGRAADPERLRFEYLVRQNEVVLLLQAFFVLTALVAGLRQTRAPGPPRAPAVPPQEGAAKGS
ncbi:MAG: hypothetical protein NTW87_19260 [Planctomycetota bacterium]|nr:hypothetical protein [Planctomycetota bacterium]